jgi:hypothetical protein
LELHKKIELLCLDSSCNVLVACKVLDPYVYSLRDDKKNSTTKNERLGVMVLTYNFTLFSTAGISGISAKH